jgi:hypothetical protein
MERLRILVVRHAEPAVCGAPGLPPGWVPVVELDSALASIARAA